MNVFVDAEPGAWSTYGLWRRVGGEDAYAFVRSLGGTWAGQWHQPTTMANPSFKWILPASIDVPDSMLVDSDTFDFLEGI